MRGEVAVRNSETVEREVPVDGAAVARWFAETWSGRVTGGERTASPADRGDRRLVRAAQRAPGRYPGAVGQLVRREILAYRDFGQCFDSSGLIAQLVSEVLSEGSGDDRDQR